MKNTKARGVSAAAWFYGPQGFGSTRGNVPVPADKVCAVCAVHYGDSGVCDEGKPVTSPHRAVGAQK